MRLRVGFALDRPTPVPVNYQELLSAAVYRLLEASDPNYSRFLHDEGYHAPGSRTKTYKLFVFSWLRGRRHSIRDGALWLGPGPVEWFLASPVDDFLTHGATGLLTAGSALRVGSACLPIAAIESVPAPEFRQTTRFTCLSPLVASLRRPDSPHPYYLRPHDAGAFSEAVRGNLRRKYELLHGRPPADDRLRLDFDPAYLARDRNGGTKKITDHGIEIIAAFAPFTLTGSPELMRIAWEAGLGEKNARGFGMIDIHGGAESETEGSSR